MKWTKRILGSLASVTAGWLACTLAWLAGGMALGLFHDAPARALTSGLIVGLYVAAIGGIFSLGTWLAAFIWIYLFLPATSPLWVWWRAMLTGGVAGAAIITALTLVLERCSNSGILLAFVPSAALTGAVAAGFAALTRGRFFRP